MFYIQNIHTNLHLDHLKVRPVLHKPKGDVTLDGLTNTLQRSSLIIEKLQPSRLDCSSLDLDHLSLGRKCFGGDLRVAETRQGGRSNSSGLGRVILSNLDHPYYHHINSHRTRELDQDGQRRI